MVALRRINGREFVLNADLIEMIEATPDTVIALTTGKKIIVQNTIEDVVKKVIKYKQLINQSIYINQKARLEDTGKG
ncbi:MAG: flagellar FlbD family protein [Chitinispirillaceae bacterium]|nr:flagellar FlbD family protein [Chitinispirillaceae bacterium]